MPKVTLPGSGDALEWATLSAPVTISVLIHQKKDPVHDLLGREQPALLLALYLHPAGFLQLVNCLSEKTQKH